LSFLYINHLACFSSGHQQVCLPAKKSRDLQDVDIFGGQGCFFVAESDGEDQLKGSGEPNHLA
jgi:hypothetical protein